MARRIVASIESRWMLAICLTFLLVWSTPTTRLAYHPEAVEIIGDQVTMYRSFPGDALGLPRPRLSYIETIRPLTQSQNDGHSCVDKGGPFRYTRADELGVWSIAWANACTSDPLGFRWEAQWTWHIGGMRVGPVELAKTVLKSG